MNTTKIANKVSLVTIFWNIVLFIFKFISGIISNSAAMISDAIHSASDVFSTIVVIIGIKCASKEADKEHPYGHERLECVAAILLAGVLFITGAGIGYKAVETIFSNNYQVIEEPGLLALIAAITSIVIKEWMYWYTKINAKKIKSGALLADAWHHRSDALSSIGALIGIIGARNGYPIMDSLASLIIFAFIVKAAYDIFIDAIDKMIDKSDEKLEKELYEFIMRNNAVIAIDLLQTRIFGNKIYVDIEIALKGDLTLNKAHEIAEQIHDDIEDSFSDIKHIMIHVNPK